MALCMWIALAFTARADQANRTLEVYWIDCEGGSATLIVTPMGETVLIDAGSDGGRDAARIVAAAKAAGVRRIDYFLLTNFRPDHLGGAAEVAQQLPFVAIYQSDLPAREPAGFAPSVYRQELERYQQIHVRRGKLTPGLKIPLQQPPDRVELELCCLAVDEKLVDPAEIWAEPHPAVITPHAIPPSDGDGSAVFVLKLNRFRFFVGSDVTWNVEAKLVAPYNLVGAIDVFQANLHGGELGNSPAFLKVIQPDVVVMTNGPRIGGEKGAIAAMRSAPGLPEIFQLHRSLNVEDSLNAPDKFVANREEVIPDEKCAANLIKMVVAPGGRHYTVSIPANQHAREYMTR